MPLWRPFTVLKRLQTAVFNLLSAGSRLRSDNRVLVVVEDETGAKEAWDAGLQQQGLCVAISAPSLSIQGGLGRATISIDVVEDVQVSERYGGRQSARETASSIAFTLNGARPIDEYGPLSLLSLGPADGETQGQRAYTLTLSTQTPLNP